MERVTHNEKGAVLMICPECKEQGLKSKVFQDQSRTTLICAETFWDEEGEYHIHDPNVTTTEYHCSNEHHRELESVTKLCPACGEDWMKGEVDVKTQEADDKEASQSSL